MIKIKRDNLHPLARRHYEEYFKKKGFLEKLEQIVEVEENLTWRKFFITIRNQIENIIMGNPNHLNEIVININKKYRSVMGKIHKHNGLKKKLKNYEKQRKILRKEFEVLRGKEVSVTRIAAVKEEDKKVACMIKLVNRYIQEGKSLIDTLAVIFDYDHFCRQYSKGNEKNGGL